MEGWLEVASASEIKRRLKTGARTDEEKLRELYLLTYSRGPNAKEIETAKNHITKKLAAMPDKEASAKRQAYEDIVWALINTKEFLFSH